MPKILGIDIGSLTIKAATYNPSFDEVEELEIVDHERQPVQKASNLIDMLLADLNISSIAFTGDFGESLAKAFNACYVNPHLAS